MSARRATLLLSLLLPTWATAAPLSLAEALAAALQESADVRTAELALDAAEADIDSARAGFDPVFGTGADVSGGRSRSFLAGFETSARSLTWSADTSLTGELPSGTSYTFGSSVVRQQNTTTSNLGVGTTEQQVSTWAFGVDATLRQDVFAALRPTAATIALRTAREARDQEALRALDTRQTTLATVSEAWSSWEVAVATIDVRARRVATAEALEATLSAQLDEGVATRADVAQVRADRLAAEADLTAARAAAQDAGDRLLVAIGWRPGATIEPGLGFPTLPSVGDDLNTHITRAQDRSPSVALAKLQVEHAQLGVRDARSSSLPSLTIDGTVGAATLASDARTALLGLADTDSTLPNYGAGITLSVPLGGRAAQASRARALASAASLDVARDEVERTVASDVSAAVRAVHTAETSAALARARLEAARAVQEAETARAEEGAARLDQLLDAVAATAEAELTVLQQDAALRIAVVTLARLEGSVDALLVRG